MPRLPRTAPSLAAGLALALALAACGGEDAKLLPGETAREITANLDKVAQLSEEGDCVGAESAVEQVGEQIDNLGGVDPKLKGALVEGAARLDEVVASCQEPDEAVAPAAVPEDTVETEAEPDKKEKEKPEPEKGKPGKEEPEAESPSPPPQANGKAKGHEKQETPEEPSETEDEAPPSGGVGAGEPAGGAK